MRTVFLVDGFNLYHSLVNAERDSGKKLKWLNLKSLCEGHLHNLRKFTQMRMELGEIHYFTALPHHLAGEFPQKVVRHEVYIKALESTGVQCHIGRFHSREYWLNCTQCATPNNFPRHEEKETDVAIASQAFHQVYMNKADAVVFVSADSDMVPAVKILIQDFGKPVLFLFPYGRGSNEIRQIAHVVRLRKEAYEAHQFDCEIKCTDGQTIRCPENWGRDQ